MHQDPNLPKPKKDAAYYVQKYGDYMSGGRNTDEELASETLPDATKPYKELVMENATKQGLSPEILFSSLNEEGVRQMVRDNEYSGDDKYPISGFAHFGLDTFGDAYPALVKKGYLPEGMDYSAQLGTNEKGQKVHTANFKTVDDAIAAKAAMMRDVKDQVDDYAKKRGYNLSDKSKQFFMLAAYNGGIGNARKMLDSYNEKGILQNDAYLTKKPDSYAGIYDHVLRRMVPAQAWKDDGIFAAPVESTQQASTPPADKGQPYYQDGKIVAYATDHGVVAAN